LDSGIIAIILICSAALARPDCTTDTASDMMQGLEASTPIDCAISSQALIAQSALGPDLGKDQYLKVVCVPKKRLADFQRLHRAEGSGAPVPSAKVAASEAP
jgi:hypothetical protein